MSPVFARLIRRAAVKALQIEWKVILLLLVGHIATSHALFFLAGEAALTASNTEYLYFYFVTASTVGFGDASPVTALGMTICWVYLIPGANSLFLLILGKLGTLFQKGLRLTMNGLEDFSKKTGHLIVIGPINERTDRFLAEMSAHYPADRIVVVSTAPSCSFEHLERFSFVRADTYSDVQAIERAGIKSAARVAIITGDDGQNLEAGFAAKGIGCAGHMAAYFQSRKTADILDVHCPEIECIVANDMEQVSRAMMAPGSSVVFSDLVSSSGDSTLQHAVVPEGRYVTLQVIDDYLEQQDSNVVCFRRRGEEKVSFRVKGDIALTTGDAVYYAFSSEIPDLVEKAMS